GLHFGLWYDDPAEPPSFVAYNYARDSAETWTSGAASVLAQVRARLDRARNDGGDDEVIRGRLRALAQALDRFADADADALAEIVEVHVAHRDLRSVDVLTQPR